ncbi:unnamed protein product [Tuber aestivum]|uniref:C2H2-type domain-containing protein n=1 Tax=Tuber aestivum TaxID=59557 RepID=A0A292PT29_9PEZI|nr:unnamed protein product [Tuber aestivum]
MGNDVPLLPWDMRMALVRMENVENQEICFQDYEQNASLLQLCNDIARTCTQASGFPNATHSNFIDPKLLGLDFGIALPAVVNATLGGGIWETPPPNHPCPPLHTPHLPKEISQPQRSRSSRTRCRHSCRECGKDFGRTSELQRHILVKHKGGTGGKCGKCGIHINRKDNLRKHERKGTCLKKMREMAGKRICEKNK